MQDKYATPNRFPGIERKVNLFLATAVIAVVAAVSLVGYKQGMFVGHTPIHFFAADAFGINKGMVVKLFGLPVGSVRTMLITDRGVNVELSIVSGYLEHVPKGSRVRLLRDGYIGAANLQIVPGDGIAGGEGRLVAGDVIEFVPNRGVPELVEEFKNQAAPVLAQMQRAIDEINNPESDFRKSVASVRLLMAQLPETNVKAQTLLRDLDRDLLLTRPELQAGLRSVTRIGTQVEEQLPTITGKLAIALDSLTETSRQLGEQAQRNGELLNAALKEAPALVKEGGNLVRDGHDLVRDGHEALEAVRNVWPLSRAFEARAAGTLPVDSFESAGPGRPAAPR